MTTMAIRAQAGARGPAMTREAPTTRGVPQDSPQRLACCSAQRARSGSNRLRHNECGRHGTAWRLTSRGRAAIVVTLLVMVSLAVVLGAFRATAASTAPPQGWGTAVVQPGDTLWDLARSVSPDGADPRPLIAQIKAVNGLVSSQVSPGQRLFMPR